MIITKKQFLENEEFYLNEIKKGKIFIYPTDTIYGIGCDASNADAIEKIREIKGRDEKPFSIIVPSKSWILKNCIIKNKKFLNKLPGKYTLILKIKEESKIAKKELIGNYSTIGVRIPDNWFAEFTSKKSLLFVTTSVNFSGENPMANVNELDEDIAKKIDYIIDDGPLEGSPSTLIDLSKETVEVIKR